MKRVVGSPGTWSGMALRLSQSVFAAASTFAMVSGFGYSNYSAFFYMNLALILQLMWSLLLACKDIFALRNKKDLHTRDNLLFIVMVDWLVIVEIYCPPSFISSEFWSNWLEHEFNMVSEPRGLEFKTLPTQY